MDSHGGRTGFWLAEDETPYTNQSARWGRPLDPSNNSPSLPSLALTESASSFELFCCPLVVITNDYNINYIESAKSLKQSKSPLYKVIFQLSSF